MTRTSLSPRCVKGGGGAGSSGGISAHGSMTVWGAKYTTALEAIMSICVCGVQWRVHGVHRPNVVLLPELTASNVALLNRVVVSPHSHVEWLQPHRYCWVPGAAKVKSSDASPQEDGLAMWRWRATAVPHGQVPSVAQSLRRRFLGQPLTYSTRLLHASRCMCWMHPSLGRNYAEPRRPCTVASRDQPHTSSTTTL